MSETPSIDLYSEDAGTGKGYKDLLQRTDIQAVIIALPILTQPEYIKNALIAGKHVLSEKPIAKDVATATELLNWYHENINTKKVTWGVAENFRFFESVAFASEQIEKLGRVLGFNVRVQSMVKPGQKYFGTYKFSKGKKRSVKILEIVADCPLETEWRKKPQHQGGFVLDAGIHPVAGLRMLLGAENAPLRVAAFTEQLQEHLPPVDTLDATVKTKSGSTGTFSLSFGTTYDEYKLNVACENGVVFREKAVADFTAGSGGAVIVKTHGGEERTEFTSEELGVKQEVEAWAKALETEREDPRQKPEEALKDLEIVS